MAFWEEEAYGQVERDQHFWGREGAPEPPLLAEELLAANGLWGKQSQFLSLFVCFF